MIVETHESGAVVVLDAGDGVNQVVEVSETGTVVVTSTSGEEVTVVELTTLSAAAIGAVPESTRNKQSGFLGIHAAANLANMTSTYAMRGDGHPAKVTDSMVSSSAAIAESKLALASDAAAATPSRRTLGTGAQQALAGNFLASNGKGFIAHGTDGTAARPVGYASIEWLGTVDPVNALDGDTWINA